MIYTQKIQHAIRFAIKTHEVYQKQKRKGKDVPYIVHPLTAGLILAKAGFSEDLIIAGILHDTIEDSPEDKKLFVPERIEERFGKKVLDLVMSVTEQNKELSWEERKAEALEHINTFSNDSLLLKSADIIANTSDIIDDYEKNGEEIFERFNASKEKLLQNYIRTITTIIDKWPENPLAEDLNVLLEKIEIVKNKKKSFGEIALGALIRGTKKEKDVTVEVEIMLPKEEEIDYYLTQEELKKRKIAFVQCEDEEECGFIVEFKYPNCTFFFCKEHKMGFNIDMDTVTDAGVLCKQHGEMERYNVLTEDNVCPSCERNTLAIMSMGIN